MELRNLDFTNVVNEQQIHSVILNHYGLIGREWVAHQWIWLNGIYKSFDDHIKFFIIISLVEKTLDFYHQVNITKSYDEYYASSYLQIDKFTIMELCEKLKLPKETIRRKVFELEEVGVIKRDKKRVIIDRSAFAFVQPIEQIPLTSKYLSKITELLFKEKILTKVIDTKTFEKIIKKYFSLCWRWFYKMQIPTFINYQEVFKDLTTFHIWGTICMNQVLNISKHLEQNSNEFPLDHFTTSGIIIDNVGNETGISAMSISEMTQIPRATIIRKCKYLIKEDLIRVNNKKQYVLSSLNFKKILPYQTEVFKFKAKFIRKILNLLVIS